MGWEAASVFREWLVAGVKATGKVADQKSQQQSQKPQKLIHSSIVPQSFLSSRFPARSITVFRPPHLRCVGLCGGNEKIRPPSLDGSPSSSPKILLVTTSKDILSFVLLPSLFPDVSYDQFQL